MNNYSILNFHGCYTVVKTHTMNQEVLLCYTYDIENVNCLTFKIIPKKLYGEIFRYLIRHPHDRLTEPYGSISPMEFYGREPTCKEFLKKVKIIHNQDDVAAFKRMFGDTLYTMCDYIGKMIDDINGRN